MIVFFIGVWLKFFFLLTPFFALSMFLSITQRLQDKQRRKLAIRVFFAVTLVCVVLFFFGNTLFALFGITLDAFRIGAGGLLFLTAVNLIQGDLDAALSGTNDDVAVVPLAIPIIIGPATIGAILILGAEITALHLKLLGFIALVAAVTAVSLILYLASMIERSIGKRGLSILSKITGLFLAALAAQMIMTGICGFMTGHNH